MFINVLRYTSPTIKNLILSRFINISPWFPFIFVFNELSNFQRVSSKLARQASCNVLKNKLETKLIHLDFAMFFPPLTLRLNVIKKKKLYDSYDCRTQMWNRTNTLAPIPIYLKLIIVALVFKRWSSWSVLQPTIVWSFSTHS